MIENAGFSPIFRYQIDAFTPGLVFASSDTIFFRGHKFSSTYVDIIFCKAISGTIPNIDPTAEVYLPVLIDTASTRSFIIEGSIK